MASIIQFGTGRFLRGFFAPIVDQASSIVVVQSLENSSGADRINTHLERHSGYHVWTRGKLNGKIVDEFEQIDSVDRAIVASQQWYELMQLAKSPRLQLIVSNTTEQGLTLDESDNDHLDFQNNCPASYPAKLLAILFQRFKAGLGGLTILPLELVEYNATKLLTLVMQQAAIWPDTNIPEFLHWLESENRWLNNLVDRIVVGVSDPPAWKSDDPLAVVAEPFRMLAIEHDGKEPTSSALPQHPMIEWVADLKPIFLRKVRILNGLHTAMVAHSLPQGFETVLDAVSDPDERQWLDRLLHDEILPALASLGLHEEEFAAQVMERFENPFFQHRLSDIANGHATKLITRIQPTIDDFRKAFGRDPMELCEIISAND